MTTETVTDIVEVEEEDALLPILGKQMPEEFTSRLDRSIDLIFRPQEWVGYEVTEQNFIWVIVLHTVGDAEVGIDRKYKVLVSGDDKEGREVSGLDLYKIMPVDVVTASECTEVALLDKDSTLPSPAATKVKEEPNLKELKTKICEELQLVWKLKSEKDKKKAIRRMYIKYHPDKAKPEEQPVYEEAFKFLQRQIDRLENGQPLEDHDDKEETPAGTPYTPSSAWSSFYRQWDSHVPKYSNFRSSSRSGGGRRNRGGGGGGIPFDFFTQQQSKPSPRKAECWLKQAQADYRALKVLEGTMNVDGSCVCQVIFLAHEVIEKALKAGMYALAGLNTSSTTKGLRCHAEAICSLESGGFRIRRIKTGGNISLIDIANKISPYFEKSRYPDKHPNFDAPVDVYKTEEAFEAAEFAEIVIDFIRNII